MDVKTCTLCGDTKQTTEFFQRTWKRKDGSRGEGLDSRCKPCSLAYHKDTYTKRLQEGDPWKLAGELVNRMRDRTIKNGYAEEVEWEKEEVFEIIKDGMCSVTGAPFRLGTSGTNKTKNPFAPSPDRLDNSIGYTKANTQWVVFIYNAMRNNFSDEDVSLFLEHLRT